MMHVKIPTWAAPVAAELHDLWSPVGAVIAGSGLDPDVGDELDRRLAAAGLARLWLDRTDTADTADPAGAADARLTAGTAGGASASRPGLRSVDAQLRAAEMVGHQLVEAARWWRTGADRRVDTVVAVGASQTSAAALVAAAREPALVDVVVCLGGSPAEAGPYLRGVRAPALLVTAERDDDPARAVASQLLDVRTAVVVDEVGAGGQPLLPGEGLDWLQHRAGLRPAVVLAADAARVDEAAAVAGRWDALVDVSPTVPLVDEDDPQIVIGAVSARGARALDPTVVCGMSYSEPELAAATATGAERAARLEESLRPRVAAARLDGLVVGLLAGDDRLGRAAACEDARQRGASRVLLVGEDPDRARAAGADGSVPAPQGVADAAAAPRSAGAEWRPGPPLPADAKPFRDRRDAGRRLAAHLDAGRLRTPVVLALPRGGVPVAVEVARALGAPVEVFVARKIGAPGHEELGIGAIAEGSDEVVVTATARALRLDAGDMEALARRERAELERRVQRYRAGRPLPSLDGRDVILVDDGLATGVTAEAAVRALRRQRPHRVILAVPVCAPDSRERLAEVADAVVCAACPPDFQAVGQWYGDFAQTSDEEVIALLKAVRQPLGGR